MNNPYSLIQFVLAYFDCQELMYIIESHRETALADLDYADEFGEQVVAEVYRMWVATEWALDAEYYNYTSRKERMLDSLKMTVSEVAECKTQCSKQCNSGKSCRVMHLIQSAYEVGEHIRSFSGAMLPPFSDCVSAKSAMTLPDNMIKVLFGHRPHDESVDYICSKL